MTSESTKKTVKLAVRSLVEQVYLSGSLGMEFVSSDRAVAGTAGHRKIQKERSDDYTAEVQISHQIETDYFILELTGRIDGIFETTDPVTIEELKTTLLNPDAAVAEDNQVHWAQLKIYAYLYALDHELPQISGRLTYYQLDTGAVSDITRTFSFGELEAFFQDVLNRYLEWANEREEWYLLRDESIRTLEFPFSEYRAGQRQMAIEVYLAVKQQEQALIQAPTGIGKTMATLFPAVKALGEGHTEKLFYLTARNTGKQAAEDAVARLRDKGLRLKTVTITAKEKSCFASDIYCRPDECAYASGYYDRIRDAMKESLEEEDLTREKIIELARKYYVCPFEFSLDLSLRADCVICDYNYAFDPRVYLKRFFKESNGSYTFLIDEAHNLVDRSRDMFSAEISRRDLSNLRKSLKTELPKMYRQLGRVIRWLNQSRKECRARGESFAENTVPETLLPLLMKFTEDAEKWLVQGIPASFRSDLTDRYFEVHRFLSVAEQFDDHYVTCYNHETGDLCVKLFCLDPSKLMEEALERARSAVFFSATLSPMEYFEDLFGCRDEIRKRTFASPFPPEHLCLLVMPTISTLYNDREASVVPVTDMILETVTRHKGNYLLFFPSYKYMQMIYDEFIGREEELDILLQTPAMTDNERELFLAEFSRDNSRTLVGFAVMGGIFGEGIDLVGDHLTGAVITGVGLPAVCLERELIREYFGESMGTGFEYAYLYPGLTRVLQAAGRVIRSETDQGVVALIDERFGRTRYRDLFPKEWQPVYITSAEKLHMTLQKFWHI